MSNFYPIYKKFSLNNFNGIGYNYKTGTIILTFEDYTAKRSNFAIVTITPSSLIFTTGNENVILKYDIKMTNDINLLVKEFIILSSKILMRKTNKSYEVKNLKAIISKFEEDIK